jgi:hypothetical protein
MFVPFNTLPPQAKVWIYQSQRELSQSETDVAEKTLRAFTEQWMVHGAPLEASFQVRSNRFVILAANDSASGCSIDNSTRLMHELGQRLSTDFFNRNLIAFLIDAKVSLIETKDLKNALEAGQWNEKTFVYNNTVSTIHGLENAWLVEAGSTWLKRYFPQKTLAK